MKYLINLEPTVNFKPNANIGTFLPKKALGFAILLFILIGLLSVSTLFKSKSKL